MLPFAMVLAIAAPTEPEGAEINLRRVQMLYDDARYEAALEKLAGGCAGAVKPIACERLRAFIHVALGEAFEARAAFDRLLAINPDASLGSDVAPKLQALFADAKRAMVDLRGLRLESSDVGGTILLEAENPSVNTVEMLTAYVALPGADTFETVVLALQGDVWSGSLRPAADWERGIARYYLEAVLVGKAKVAIGTAASPYELQVAGGSGGARDDGGHDGAADGDGDDRLDWGLVVEEEERGRSGWAPWLIGGGVLLAVGTVTAVVLGVVFGSQSVQPGTVLLTITYEDR